MGFLNSIILIIIFFNSETILPEDKGVHIFVVRIIYYQNTRTSWVRLDFVDLTHSNIFRWSVTKYLFRYDEVSKTWLTTLK